ncbi:MAG: S8 family peptidase, partial [Paludibacteraceae bacterium]|nr:S8 family peptidase [Paludibacteraceae bacterium]
MKKFIFFVLAIAAVMVAVPMFAQDRNNEDEVVKVDSRRRDYREGEVLVKFKPTSRVNVRAKNGRFQTSAVSAVDAALEALGVDTVDQLMPLTGRKVSQRRMRAANGAEVVDTDMSKLYRMKFNREKIQSVHEAIETLKALPEVEYAEPNYVVYALQAETNVADIYGKEPLYKQQHGLSALNLHYLWNRKKITEKRSVIAILDTGVDTEHPDLEGNIWTNEAEANGAEEQDDDANGFADDLHGWDFVNQTANVRDFNGHGTHCAGIAAAVGNNGIGITGANPDALIMPIAVMQSDGTGDVATIIKGIDYATANGADVLSMSFGGYQHSIAEEQALAKAYAKMVLVAAAGNDGGDINACHFVQTGPMFPAAFTFVLGVEAGDEKGNLAGFSNYDCNGPLFSSFGEEQLYNYELRAPGLGIVSTYPGGQYKSLNGTSMACPLVAGAISALLERKEYASKEILFGDLIYTRKMNGYANVDFKAAYDITDEDRKPELSLVSYAMVDSIGGDGDGRPDSGDTISFYPVLKNMWGQAENIKITLQVGELEDPEIITVLDS